MRNSLLTCVAALSIGTGLILNSQNVKAATDPIAETQDEKALNNNKADLINQPENGDAPQTAQSSKESSGSPNSSKSENTQPAAASQPIAPQAQQDQATPVAEPNASANNALTTVDKDSFNDAFETHGSATYDQNSGIVTLTPDKNNEVGNFTLKEKIDLSQDFTLKGQVNLGNKPENRGGADGMGFAFHPGNTDAVGNAGGNMGIGGLPNALGFKLDTFHNADQRPGSSKSNAEIDPKNSNDFGWSEDPTKVTQFGVFVTTAYQNKVAANGITTDRWWATTDKSSVQNLSSNDLDGKFHDFSIDYFSTNRIITVNYQSNIQAKPLVWTAKVPDSDKAFSLSVTSSTGGNKNQHQFKFESMTYSTAASVNVRHVDYFTGKDLTEDNTLQYDNGEKVDSNYSTSSMTIPNYTYIGLNGATSKVSVKGKEIGVPVNVRNTDVEKSIEANGKLSQEGNNGTVVYVYIPNAVIDGISATPKTVNETIHYVEQGTKTTLAGDNLASVTFITGSADDKNGTIYYNDNSGLSMTDKNAWKAGSTSNFSAVNNPNITGYHVVEIDKNEVDPEDLTEVEKKTVDSNGPDQVYTVYYAKDNSTSEGGNGGGSTTNPEKPVDPEEPVNPVDPETPIDPDGSVDPEKPVDPDGTIDPENPTEPNESIDPNETTDPSETSKPELNLNENIKDNNDGIDDLEWNTSKENDRINTINNNVTSEVTAPEKNFENLITNNQLSKLPQTGNQKTSWLSYLGIALMMFIPAFLKKH